MNYIGSKYRLLGEIEALLSARGIPATGTFCDAFAGTGVVSQRAKARGHRVIANDIQRYGRLLAEAFVVQDGWPAFEKLAAFLDRAPLMPAGWPVFGPGAPVPELRAEPLARVLMHLDALPGLPEHPFAQAYGEGGRAGRLYFSAANAERIAGVREQIAAWEALGLLTPGEHALLLASVLESADAVANTASVYGAYLKRLKSSALARFTLRLPCPLSASGPGGHRAYQEDANALMRRLAAEGEHLDVLYLDPPYNRRQYHANYHLLETIAAWDLGSFEPSGKTGLRPAGAQRSAYALGKQAKEAMRDLLHHAPATHILVSYNDEGLIPEADLVAMLEAISPSGERHFKKLTYPRFRADKDSATRRYRSDTVTEFLFYVRKG